MPLILLSAAILLAVAAAIGMAAHPKWGAIAAIAALILAYHVAVMLHRAATRLGGGAEAAARRRIDRFLMRNPHWHLRLYRTPAGLRLLAVHATFDPADPEVATFFQAIGVDPVYARMCFRQHCFRARVSPKPWRIGISQHIRPETVWPVAPEKLPERRRWLDRYEQKAQEFSACRYLDSLGSGRLHPKTQDVQRWHDELCRAHVPLPIA